VSGSAMIDPDFLGAEGGRIALGFAAGCGATWTFLKAAVSGPVNRAYERRITDLEKENTRCNDRVSQLETVLLFHGPGEMRQAMQKSLSEEHIERLRNEEQMK
jgi:hypothetical protein